ncbi:MAG: inositol monophosphatase [Gammaproteobacteria bacterium]|nr:MAG: inositol monophosphatase [Gammaproteobacteria bacterium]
MITPRTSQPQEARVLFHEPLLFLDEIETIARLGAEKLMPRFRSLEAHQITEKARNDLVTVADREAEAAILEAIAERFPDHAVLSEEAGWHQRDPSRPTWIVDPLDGTTNFVHGLAHFAVSIGVAYEDEMLFGVVLDPVKNDIFRGAKGHGAWWNGERCSVSSRTSLPGCLLATGFPFKAHDVLDRYLAIFREVFLRCKAIRRPGSAALDLAYTAAGLYDGFFEFRLAPWDLAGGTLLVEEAGGTVTAIDGGEDIMSEGSVLCGPAGVVAELLEIINQVS